jgi:hypothetical protein
LLKLGSNRKGIGTPVPCPVCRYPNLGIYIWCERCGAPLDWTRPSPAPVSDVPTPLPVVPVPEPEPATLQPDPAPPAFTLPRVSLPSVAWPQLRIPRWTVPTLSPPRVSVPRLAATVVAVAAVLIVLVVVAGRQSTPGRLPSTAADVGATALSAAIPGVEAKTSLHYQTKKCATNAPCLRVASQTAGTDAAAVLFSTAATAGRQCVGYVYRSSGRWHFHDAVCGLPDQLSPLIGHDATVHLPANCANVRETASLQARVIACLNAGSTIHVDGGPTYADGRLWWHETQGWIAHEFLIVP